MNARMRKPSTLPAMGYTPGRGDWAAGWYTGLAVGAVTGVALAVLLGWLQ